MSIRRPRPAKADLIVLQRTDMHLDLPDAQLAGLAARIQAQQTAQPTVQPDSSRSPR